MKYQVNEQKEIEFPEAFTLDEFRGLLGLYFAGEKVEDRVVEAACMYFCSDFPGAVGTVEQLEVLCGIISELLSVGVSALDVANRVSALLGGPGFVAPLTHAQGANTLQMLEFVRTTVKKQLESAGWQEVCGGRRQSFVPGTTSESEAVEGDNEEKDAKEFESRANVVKNPGFILSDKALWATPEVSADFARYLEESLSVLSTGFYQFEEIRTFALRFLTRRVVAGGISNTVLQGLDRLFGELGSFTPQLIEAQYTELRLIGSSFKLPTPLGDVFALKYLLKPLAKEASLRTILANSPLAPDAAVTVAAMIVSQDPQALHKLAINQEVLRQSREPAFPSAGAMGELDIVNEDVVETVEALVKKLGSQIFTASPAPLETDFIGLFFQLMWITTTPGASVAFDAQAFSRIVQKETLSVEELFSFLALSPNGQGVFSVLNNKEIQKNPHTALLAAFRFFQHNEKAEVDISGALDFLCEHKEKFDQGQIKILNKILSVDAQSKQKQAGTSFDPAELRQDFIRHLDQIPAFLTALDPVNVAHQEAFVELLHGAEEIPDEMLDALVQKWLFCILEGITADSRFLQQLIEMALDAYDISPRLCGRLNGGLSGVQNKMPVYFYAGFGWLRILQGYKRIGEEEIISGLERMLSEYTGDVAADANQNNAVLNYYVFMAQVLLELSQEAIQKQKKTFNKLWRFLLGFPFSFTDAYVRLLGEITEAFAEGKQGVLGVLNYAAAAFDLLVTNGIPEAELQDEALKVAARYRKGLAAGLLALHAFEFPGLLNKSEAVSSKTIVQWVGAEAVACMRCPFLAQQLLKLCRNAAMHEAFQCTGAVLELMQKIMALATHVIAIQTDGEELQLVQETAVSLMLLLGSKGLVTGLLGCKLAPGASGELEFTQEKVTKLEAPVKNASLLEAAARLTLKLPWNDSNSAEIAMAYLDEGLQSKKIRIPRQLAEQTAARLQAVMEEMTDSEEFDGSYDE